ncbi:MAG: hypothetical protein M1816_004986 [Peltula sp. TS41687]|nr:MAG: hypothetical protein M1816_004986 [Peltula sp. TS41687]
MPKPAKARMGLKAKDQNRVLSGRISRGGPSGSTMGSKQVDKEYIWVDEKGKEFLRLQRKENLESGQQAADIWNWAVQKGNKLSKLIPLAAYQDKLLQEEVDAINLQANAKRYPTLLTSAGECRIRDNTAASSGIVRNAQGQYAKPGTIQQQTPAQAQKAVLLTHWKDKLKYNKLMQDAYTQTVFELEMAIRTAEDPTMPKFDPPKLSADAEALLRLTEKSGFNFGHGKSGITKNFEDWAKQEREHLAVVAERLRQEISPLVIYVNRVWEAIGEKEHKAVAAASYIHDELDTQGLFVLKADLVTEALPAEWQLISADDIRKYLATNAHTAHPIITSKSTAEADQDDKEGIPRPLVTKEEASRMDIRGYLVKRNPALMSNGPTQAIAPLIPAGANDATITEVSIQPPAISSLQARTELDDTTTTFTDAFKKDTRGPEHGDTAETRAGSQSETEDETERLLRAQLLGNESDEAGYVTAPEEDIERSEGDTQPPKRSQNLRTPLSSPQTVAARVDGGREK